MRFLVLIFILLVIAPGHSHAKDYKAKPYKEVKYLYEHAVKSIKKIEDQERKDLAFTDVAIEVLEHKDFEFSNKILKEIQTPMFQAEVSANIARALALDKKCSESKEWNTKAHNDVLKEELEKGKNKSHYRTNRTFSRLLESYALCKELKKANGLITQYKVNPSEKKQYKATSFSIIGAMLEIKGDRQLSQEYFNKAKNIARPLKDETQRSYALSKIAKNEVIAGLLKEAVETAKEILPTKNRPKSFALPFFSFKDPLLRRIAFHYALKDDFHNGFATLDLVSVHSFYNSEAFVIERIRHLKKKKHQSKNPYKVLEIILWDNSDIQSTKALLEVSKAYAEDNEIDVAIEIIKNIIAELEIKIRNPRRAESEKNRYFRLIADAYYVLVFVTNDTSDTYAALTSKAYEDVKIYQLDYAWGAILAHSFLNKNNELKSEIENRAGSKYLSAFQYKAFLYLVEKKKFSEARAFIEEADNSNKKGMFTRLAREQMGISYWHRFWKDIKNGI